MSEPTDAASGNVPGPRSAPLPLPPTAVSAGPEDGDMTDAMEEAYWSVRRLAASSTVRQVLVRLPRITALIGRLAWQADRASTLTAVVCQLASAAMAAFGLIASVGVLQHLFAQGPTPIAYARPSRRSSSSRASSPPVPCWRPPSRWPRHA